MSIDWNQTVFKVLRYHSNGYSTSTHLSNSCFFFIASSLTQLLLLKSWYRLCILFEDTIFSVRINIPLLLSQLYISWIYFSLSWTKCNVQFAIIKSNFPTHEGKDESWIRTTSLKDFLSILSEFSTQNMFLNHALWKAFKVNQRALHISSIFASLS